MNNETEEDDGDIFSAIGGFIDNLKVENEALKASLKKWEEELSSVMPPDYKDWWQNSKEEWPLVAKWTILSLRENEELAWDFVNRLRKEHEVENLTRSAYNEWVESPSGNSAIANLRNNLCSVIGEREDLKDSLEKLKQESQWIYLPEMPEDRIRVIAADKISVIGDCFFGHASYPTFWCWRTNARLEIERWEERLWRHTLDESPCDLTPIMWMPLPKIPKNNEG